MKRQHPMHQTALLRPVSARGGVARFAQRRAGDADPRRRAVWHLTPIVAAFAVAMGTIACGGHTTPSAQQIPPVTVTTTQAEVREGPDLFEAGGTVRGRTSATLASRVMAPIREVLVQPGDRVRAGQPLVLLDDRDVAAVARQARARSTAAARGLDAAHTEQEAAEAALVLARATHGRLSSLLERKSATAQEFDQAVAALRAAETRVTRVKVGIEEARAGLDVALAGRDAADVSASFTRIVAPFDGLVTEKLVEPGNLATPGTPLLRMEDPRAFKLDVRVDESRAAWVVRDTPVTVRLEGPSGPVDVSGRVFEVARAIDADSRAFLVTIALPAAEAIRPGTFARAYLPGPTRRVLRIPDTAIVRRGQLTSVFVVDRGKARLRLVSIGISSSARTEVLAGLSDGETVVMTPPPALRDGTPVTVRNSAAPAIAAATGGRS
jgi:RND family efflux transporter MFP subunit